METLKKIWAWIEKIITAREFIFTFPLAVFGLLAFILHSFLMVIVLTIWVIATINASKQKDEG